MTHLDTLLAWYAGMSPQTLQRIGELYHPQASFKDPFNEVRGVPAIRAIFEHMFATTQAPRFIIRESLGAGACGFVTWDFTFGIGGRSYTVHGATRLRFDADGRVTEHRDYWDPAEELWQKMPLIGGAVAWLRRRFGARSIPARGT